MNAPSYAGGHLVVSCRCALRRYSKHFKTNHSSHIRWVLFFCEVTHLHRGFFCTILDILGRHSRLSFPTKGAPKYHNAQRPQEIEMLVMFCLTFLRGEFEMTLTLSVRKLNVRVAMMVVQLVVSCKKRLVPRRVVMEARLAATAWTM